MYFGLAPGPVSSTVDGEVTLGQLSLRWEPLSVGRKSPGSGCGLWLLVGSWLEPRLSRWRAWPVGIEWQPTNLRPCPPPGERNGEGQSVEPCFLPAWPWAPSFWAEVPSPTLSSAAFDLSYIFFFYLLFQYVALVDINPSKHFIFLQIFWSL